MSESESQDQPNYPYEEFDELVGPPKMLRARDSAVIAVLALICWAIVIGIGYALWKIWKMVP